MFGLKQEKNEIDCMISTVQKIHTHDIHFITYARTHKYNEEYNNNSNKEQIIDCWSWRERVLFIHFTIRFVQNERKNPPKLWFNVSKGKKQTNKQPRMESTFGMNWKRYTWIKMLRCIYLLWRRILNNSSGSRILLLLFVSTVDCLILITYLQYLMLHCSNSQLFHKNKTKNKSKKTKATLTSSFFFGDTIYIDRSDTVDERHQLQ